MRTFIPTPAPRPTTMLDEDALVAILARHFPGARPEVVRKAAEDVLMLDLLARDAGIVWEDAMQDDEQATPVSLFDRHCVRES